MKNESHICHHGSPSISAEALPPPLRRRPRGRSSSPPGPGSLGSGGEQAAPGRDLPGRRQHSCLGEVSRKIRPEPPGGAGSVTWGLCASRPRPTPQPTSSKRPKGFRPRSPTSISRLGALSRRRPADRESNPAARRKHSMNEGGIGEKIIFFSTEPVSRPGGVCGGQSSSRGDPSLPPVDIHVPRGRVSLGMEAQAGEDSPGAGAASPLPTALREGQGGRLEGGRQRGGAEGGSGGPRRRRPGPREAGGAAPEESASGRGGRRLAPPGTWARGRLARRTQTPSQRRRWLLRRNGRRAERGAATGWGGETSPDPGEGHPGPRPSRAARGQVSGCGDSGRGEAAGRGGGGDERWPAGRQRAPLPFGGLCTPCLRRPARSGLFPEGWPGGARVVSAAAFVRRGWTPVPASSPTRRPSPCGPRPKARGLSPPPLWRGEGARAGGLREAGSAPPGSVSWAAGRRGGLPGAGSGAGRGGAEVTREDGRPSPGGKLGASGGGRAFARGARAARLRTKCHSVTGARACPPAIVRISLRGAGDPACADGDTKGCVDS